jgi:predicted PurR-regulated permease PerM
VLLATVLLVGAVFFQVMAQFIVPLFLACVLLVVFQPLHAWVLGKLPGHPRVSALVTTILILLVVLLPLTGLGWKAYQDFHSLATASDPNKQPTVDTATIATKLKAIALDLGAYYERWTGEKFDQATVTKIVERAATQATTLLISGIQHAFGVLVGLAIMVISLYYFLADGPAMIRTALDLSPLDSEYEQELLARFGHVSRAVVVATLLSAIVQGSLAGIGYHFALPAGAPIFLLTAVTMVTAMVPFVGAAAMWIPVCVWIFLQGPREVDGIVHKGDWVTAVILAAYSTVVVSGIDNVIKPLVLRGQSNLHPLLALLSILGGVQVLGPVGILVGPMLVSFLQALLEMLRKELDSFSEPEQSVVEVLAGTAVPPAGALAAPGDSASAPAPRPPQAKQPAGRFRRRKK